MRQLDRSTQIAEAEEAYASLVVKIDLCEAIPVRAIPFATGWSISPDELAKQLARVLGAPFDGLSKLVAYHIVDDQPKAMAPKEWDRYVANLAALEARLKTESPDDEQGYASWLSSSVKELPEGVFLWLNEFRRAFADAFSPERLTLLQEREGDRELNLSPHLDDSTLSMVLRGFGTRNPPVTLASADTMACLIETVNNGRAIDWAYWVELMPRLNARDASRLLAGLDPELYLDLNARPVPKNNVERACADAAKIERLAEAEGRDRLPPSDWFHWAHMRGLPIHRGFFIAARGRHLVENAATVLSNMPSPEARTWNEGHDQGQGRRQIRTVFAGHSDTVVRSFPQFCADVEERLARWRRGRYTLIEAAQVMADANPDGDAELLARQLDIAVHSGELAIRRNNVPLRKELIPAEHLWHRELLASDVNEWSSRAGAAGGQLLSYPYSNPAENWLSGPADSTSGAVAWYDFSLSASSWWTVKALRPSEAATLLCEQDPHKDPTPEATTTSETTPLDFKKLLRAFEDAAEEEHGPRSLNDWRLLARSKGLKYHSWADEYAKAVLPTSDSGVSAFQGSKDALGESGTEVVRDALAMAASRAKEIIKEKQALDQYPSQEDLGYMVAEEFRKKGIVGADGKPLTGATIKRHALKGISSAKKKKLSMAIRRGK